jgi:uncharacterized membrane protein
MVADDELTMLFCVSRAYEGDVEFSVLALRCGIICIYLERSFAFVLTAVVLLNFCEV